MTETGKFTLSEVGVFHGLFSPRGAFTVGKSHNPVQDIYLRKVEGKENKLVNVAIKGLADPARGCRMPLRPPANGWTWSSAAG